MNTIDEKTFKQGVDEFIGCAPEGGWSDYWAMQQDWEFYKDSLCRDGVITQKQADSWSNPCTPETFARWQKRNGLVRRGYESKKSEASYDYQDPRGGTAASLFSLHMKELLGSWIKAGNRSKYKVYVTEDRSAGSPVWTVHIDVNGEPVASVSFSDGNYTYTRFDNNKTTTGKVADFNKRGRVIYPMATEILNMVGKILGEGDSNESKKSEDTYDRPVTLYASTRYDDAEEAQKFLDSISGGEVKVSKERNGDTLYVSIEGADDAIDTFLAVYKDNYDTLEQDCDADVNGWTDPVDLKYYTVQGRKELTGESHKKSEASGNIRYDVPISSTTYVSELESLVSKLKTLGISVKPKIYAEEDSTNGYAEYKLFGANSRDDIVVIVAIRENHYTRITAITNRGKLVMEGYGQTFDEALSALNTVEESKKSEALTKDTIVVGQIFNSNLKWIERTLKQVKKKFPNVESDAFGNTLTIRGKLSDVSDVCNTYKTGSYMLCQDNGDAFLPNAAGDDLDDAEISKALSESKKSEGIGDRIKMGIDYNMFMRMCGSAAYLDDNEDYWDALWEYYSEMGEIEDACEFFDNLFQYTAWCDEDEVYDEYLDDKFKDESKSKEECIQAAIDDGDLNAYKHEKGNYLVIL